MDRKPFEYDFGRESDDEEEKDSKPKKRDAKKLGSVAGKSVNKSSEKEEGSRKPREFFLEKPVESDTEKPKREPSEEADSINENAPSKLETTSDSEALKQAKREFLRQQLQKENLELQHTIETTAKDSPEYVEAVALKNATEQLAAKAEDPSVETDPAIDEEFDRRMAEVTDEEVAEFIEEVPEAGEVNTTEQSPDEEAEEPSDDTAQTSSSTTVQPTSPTTQAQQAGAQNRTPQQPSWQPTTHPAVAPPVNPPSPPNTPPPRSPGGSSGSGGNSGGGNYGGSSINLPPAMTPPNNPNAYTTPVAANNPNREHELEDEVAYQRGQRRKALLVGGIVGYAVGRRGGRKRAEAKLKPEIKNLNKELTATKQHLASRETELKRAASTKLYEQQTRTRGEVEPDKPIRRSATELLRQTVMAPENFAEKVEQSQQPDFETTPITEATVAKQAEKTPQAAEPAKKVEMQPKTLEKLSTPEILAEASALYISGTSVRSLYETNQIDRKGLITIVEESRRGGDIKEAFEKVELGRERQHERAREFRHDDPTFTPAPPPTSQPLQPVQATNIQQTNRTQDTATAPPSSNTPLNTSNANPDQTSPLEQIKKSKPNYVTPTIILAIGITLLFIWFVSTL